MAGDIESYTEEEFLENLGMFLGVVSHHIGDLCTPIHVEHKIDFKKMGFESLSKLHKKIEQDIEQMALQANVRLTKSKPIRISKNYFWDIPMETYEKHFILLEALYLKPEEKKLLEMVSEVASSGVKYTWNV